MAVNKVIYGNTTVLDITDSTVTPETLAKGEVGYSKAGERIVGTMEAGGGASVDTCTVVVNMTGFRLDMYKFFIQYTRYVDEKVVAELTEYQSDPVSDTYLDIICGSDVVVIGSGYGAVSRVTLNAELLFPATVGSSFRTADVFKITAPAGGTATITCNYDE